MLSWLLICAFRQTTEENLGFLLQVQSRLSAARVPCRQLLASALIPLPSYSKWKGVLISNIPLYINQLTLCQFTIGEGGN